MTREDEFVEDVLWALNEIVDETVMERVFYGYDSENPRKLTLEGVEADLAIRSLLKRHNVKVVS